MNSRSVPVGTKSFKQMEYVKQQEQLRALGNSRCNSNSLSADTMIENLLSKKETFQKKNSDPQQKQEVAGWLSGVVPPMYSQVWASVQSANSLAHTPTLSNLLMSSGLPTDTLAYIWSLANRTVPGALTQQEVYLVLALVALIQSGYHVTNLATVLQLPQAPIPALDLALLPPPPPPPPPPPTAPQQPLQQIFPTPLSVSSLPDSHTYNWVTPEIQLPSDTDKIGISYLSNRPIISPTPLTETSVLAANLSFTDFNINSGKDGQSGIPASNMSMVVESGSKSTHTKHSGNTFTFSFPSLNESPSHIARLNSEAEDSLDEEFSDFQSADFTTQAENHKTAIVNDDEYSNFQKASLKFEDDLSVLVVDGKNIPSAQSLWVTENPPTFNEGNLNIRKSQSTEMCIDKQDFFKIKQQPTKIKVERIEDKIQKKYEIFHKIDDSRFSVFHIPLPDEDDKLSVLIGNKVQSKQLEAKSIFTHSLFKDPEQSSDLFKPDLKLDSMDLSKSNLQSNTSDGIVVDVNDDDDDDEFSTFQNFPVSFPDSANLSHTENVDKYDVFRTIVLSENTDANHGSKTEGNKLQYSFQGNFEEEMDLFQIPERKTNENESELIRSSSGKAIEDINCQVSAAPSPSNGTSDIGDLFSSLAISNKNLDLGTNNPALDIGIIEDRYKALRLLEDNPNEVDDFGEFLVADVPSHGNQPIKLSEKPSIQVRCLEACLNLLKDGLITLSRASSQEVISEVLSDPRASTYLDCLLEVHRVGERIISNMDSDESAATKAELNLVWDKLGPFFTHTEHNHLTETLGAQCGVCRSNTGPSPVTFGAMTFHSPCANLYLHCVEPVLPNITSTPFVS